MGLLYFYCDMKLVKPDSRKSGAAANLALPEVRRYTLCDVLMRDVRKKLSLIYSMFHLHVCVFAPVTRYMTVV